MILNKLLVLLFLCLLGYIRQAICMPGEGSQDSGQESHQRRKLDIDLNKPFITEEDQSEQRAISHDMSIGSSQAFASNKKPRPYAYKPRKANDEYSQTYSARTQRNKAQKIREKGGKELDELLERNRKDANDRSKRFNEATKRLGYSIRPQNVRMREITSRVRKGLATEKEMELYKDRQLRAIKGDKARTNRLREARIAVMQGNPTPAQLAELEKRRAKNQRSNAVRKKRKMEDQTQ